MGRVFRMYSIWNWNCLKGLWKLWWISVHFRQPGLGVKIPLHIAPSKPLRIKASPLSFYPGECSSFPLIHVWWQLWMWRPHPFSPYSTKSRRQPWQIIHTRHLHHLLKFTHFHKDSLVFFRLFYHRRQLRARVQTLICGNPMGVSLLHSKVKSICWTLARGRWTI